MCEGLPTKEANPSCSFNNRVGEIFSPLSHHHTSDCLTIMIYVIIINDLIAKDNVIDSYVESLDLKELRFTEYSGTNRGQAPYRRSDLLKLHIYEYLNNIRSSRALEAEEKRNIELMWLINGLSPQTDGMPIILKKPDSKNYYRAT